MSDSFRNIQTSHPGCAQRGQHSSPPMWLKKWKLWGVSSASPTGALCQRFYLIQISSWKWRRSSRVGSNQTSAAAAVFWRMEIIWIPPLLSEKLKRVFKCEYRPLLFMMVLELSRHSLCLEILSKLSVFDRKLKNIPELQENEFGNTKKFVFHWVK